MSTNNASATGGIGFTGLLTLLFIALKLTGVIAWPWIWVLSPLWISVVLGIIIITAVVVLLKHDNGSKVPKGKR
jgi:MFS superfamily sulfate permease-like transporter